MRLPKNLALVGLSALIGLGFLLTAEPASQRTATVEPTAVLEVASPATPRGIEPSTAHQREHAEANAYAAPAGRQMDFRVRSTFAMTMKHLETGEGGLTNHTCEGTLRLTVLGRLGSEILVQVGFPSLDVYAESDGHLRMLDEIERELEGRFVVRMRSTGEILGYRFPPCAAVTRRTVRALVAGLHFVVPVRGDDSWETRETSAMGSSRCRYTVLERRGERHSLRRERLAYLERDLARAELGGATSGVLDTRVGWMREVEGEETLSLRDEESGFGIEYHTRTKYSLDRETDVDVPDMDRSTWDAEEAPPTGLEDVEDQEVAATYEDVHVPSLLAEVARALENETLTDAQARAFFKQLADVLRNRPEALATVRDLLLDPATEPRFAQRVLSGVGMADTPAAQELLADVLTSASSSDATRGAAATATLAMRTPTNEWATALDETWRDVEQPLDVRQSSLLMLGACARRNSTALQRLLRLGSSLDDPHQVQVWLHALGNSHSNSICRAVAPYLGAEDESTRHAAIGALAKVSGPDRDALLRKALQGETNPHVKKALEDALAGE